jgi:hypothetical protein
MAESPQYPVQIMENQTRFDLTAALENWRQDLATQPQLSAEDRRELETHLRDSLAELKQRGLNEQESFWLARRRLGPPAQIAEEFAKAVPLSIWRARMPWIAAGAVLCYGLTTGQEMLSNLLDPSGEQNGMGLYFGLFAIPALALLAFAWMVRRGQAPAWLKCLGTTPRSPRWAATVLSVLLALIVSAAYLSANRIGRASHDLIATGAVIEMITTWLFSALWPALFILSVFLMPRPPAQNRLTPRRA